MHFSFVFYGRRSSIYDAINRWLGIGNSNRNTFGKTLRPKTNVLRSGLYGVRMNGNYTKSTRARTLERMFYCIRMRRNGMTERTRFVEVERPFDHRMKLHSQTITRRTPRSVTQSFTFRHFRTVRPSNPTIPLICLHFNFNHFLLHFSQKLSFSVVPPDCAHCTSFHCFLILRSERTQYQRPTEMEKQKENRHRTEQLTEKCN